MGTGLKKFFALFGAQGEAVVNKANLALTAWDPETATQVDRDELERNFRGIAIQLAQSKEHLKAEEADVAAVTAEKDRYIKAAENAIASGKQDTAVKLMDEAEKLTQKLSHEEKERQAAAAIVANYQGAHDKLKKRVEEFDAKAKEALDALAEAKSEKAAAAAVRKSEALVASSANATAGESALAGLGKLAAKARAEAAVDETMTNLGRSIAEKDADVAAELAAVDAGAAAGETLEQRLARLKGK